MMEVYTLLVECGRVEGDDLPAGSVGAGFLLFAPARDEQMAVNEAVAVLREAGLNPLEVTNYGTIAERAAADMEMSEEELNLAQEAADESAIIIIDKQVFFDEEHKGLLN